MIVDEEFNKVTSSFHMGAVNQGNISEGAQNLVMGTMSGVKTAVGKANLVKAAVNGDAQSQGRVTFQAVAFAFAARFTANAFFTA